MVESISTLSRDLTMFKDSVRASVTGLSKAMSKLDVAMEAPQSVRELVERQEQMARQVLEELASGTRSLAAAAEATSEQSKILVAAVEGFAAAQATEKESAEASRELLQQLSASVQVSAQGVTALREMLPKLDELLAAQRQLLVSAQTAPDAGSRSAEEAGFLERIFGRDR
jgi:hypothetical protein